MGTQREDGRPQAQGAASAGTGPAHSWASDLQPPGCEEVHFC